MTLGEATEADSLESFANHFSREGLGAEPAAALAAPFEPWIGQYGHPPGQIDISESGGHLILSGGPFDNQALKQIDRGVFKARVTGHDDVVLQFDGDAVRFAGTILPRHDLGAEAETTIRAAIQADASTLRANALAAQPPSDEKQTNATDLVPVQFYYASIAAKLVYADHENIFGMAFYDEKIALVQRPVARALAQVSAALAPLGYGLWVTDAYRPWFVTKMMWDAVPEQFRNFVADPLQGSRHNRGCAVDLTLCDLRSRRPVEMPSRIDEFSQRSCVAYQGGTTRQRWLRDLLRAAMEMHGFSVYEGEWWHFDFNGWEDYPILNHSLASIIENARSSPFDGLL